MIRARSTQLCGCGCGKTTWLAPHIEVKKGKEFRCLDDLAQLVPQQLIGIAVAVRVREELASKAEYGYSPTEFTEALLGALPEEAISPAEIAPQAEEGEDDGN